MSSFLFSASAVRYLKIIEKLKRAWVDPLRLPDYNHTWYTIACVFYFSLYAYQSDQENKSIFSTYITRYNSAQRPLLAQTQTPERRPFLNTRGRTGSSAVTKLAVKFDIPSVNPAGPPHLYTCVVTESPASCNQYLKVHFKTVQPSMICREAMR